jgi:hypothetical protein
MSAIDLLDGIPLKGVGSEHLRDRLILPAHLSTGLFGVAGDLSIINAGDAAVAGSTGKVADAAHQHQCVTGAAASLALTAANSEGGSASSARADHGHSTNALPWGVVGSIDEKTTDSSGFSAPGTADWLLDELSVSVTRRYKIYILTAWGITGGTDRALISAHADGTQVLRLGDTDTVPAGSFNVLSANGIWLPATGTPDIDIRITGLSGTGTFTFFAGATFPRQLWVEDVGPRP